MAQLARLAEHLKLAVTPYVSLPLGINNETFVKRVRHRLLFVTTGNWLFSGAAFVPSTNASSIPAVLHAETV